ncbi:MAG: UbiA family prenyltransferase, partial [Rudaea sp.]
MTAPTPPPPPAKGQRRVPPKAPAAVQKAPAARPETAVRIAAQKASARRPGLAQKNAATRARRDPAVPKGALARLLARVDWVRVRERLFEYAKLARMHKPIGAALLLWPTWWALWLAAGDFPPWPTLLIFTLGVFLMRSAGCVIND